ncbi:MAG: hypothetical protein ACI37R_01860 [Candidatus Avigastranaerophilus sp.]
MGLSSLQGRLLMLVGRQSDVELQQMDISEMQNRLAMTQMQVAQEYNDALNNKKLVIKVEKDSDTFEYEKKDVDYETMSSEGLVAVTARNEVLLKKDKDGNWIIPTTKDGEELVSIENGKAIILNDTEKTEYKIKDGTKYLANGESITKAFENGALYMIDTQNPGSAKISSIGIASQSEMEWVLDTSDDAAAETKYQYELAKISKQDNTYDIEMEKLETEHTALSKEYESTTKAIDSNIERTFNLFQNG